MMRISGQTHGESAYRLGAAAIEPTQCTCYTSMGCPGGVHRLTSAGQV